MKYINEEGLRTLWSKIKERFDLKIVNTSNTTHVLEVNTYTVCTKVSSTFTFTLPTIEDSLYTRGCMIFISTSTTTPNITFNSDKPIIYAAGFDINSNSMYELNAVYNGTLWIITQIPLGEDSINFVQSDWNETDTFSSAYINNKPDLNNYIEKGSIKTINGQSLVGEGDITIQGGGTVDLSEYAKLDSPVFTGNPTAPTKDITTNNTSIATTKFVHDVVNNDLKDYIKTVNVNDNPVTITDNTLNLTIPELLVKIKNGSEYQGRLLTDIIDNVPDAVDYLLGYFVLDHSSDCDILVARDNNGYKQEIRLLSFLYNSNTEKYTLQLAVANEIFYIEWVEDDNRYEIFPLIPHPTANGLILSSHDGKWYATTPTVYYTGTNLPDNSQGNNGDLYFVTE